ncbi:MAG: hypothetical protein C4329_07070 [Chitinophagaceae bacterium]
MKKYTLLFILLSSLLPSVTAQEVPIDNLKFIYYPHPLIRKWTTSVGIIATTMPYEITEELHYRIPAIDVYTVHRITDHFSIDARGSIQGVQNIFTIGPKWNVKLTDRVAGSLGYWFGFINAEGFKTTGHGWQNFPNLSLGYRFNKAILLTFRAESIITLNIKAIADQTPITHNYSRLSGSSYTITLEQPFYGNKSLTLGFSAIYSKFFWQTWSAFTNFDRDFFYPQLIVGLIL